MKSVDLLVLNAAEVLTLANREKKPKKGEAMASTGLIPHGGIAIKNGKIVALGESRELEKNFKAEVVLDATGRVVTPGFVDPHTHPVFAKTRELEFEMRIQGKTYQAIAAAGGGINSSVKAMRSASDEELTSLVRSRFDSFLRHGTTTVEAKSGYGLSTEHEVRSLRILKKVADDHPLSVVPTFLGAHEFPPEYRENKEEYVRILVEEMIPAVAKEGLAEYCDIFTEDGVYTVEQTRRILSAAQKAGLKLKLHVDEFCAIGGTELAGEMKADSADHLGAITETGMEALKAGGVVPVLLPGTSFFLAHKEFAPARRMIDEGLPVAVGSDFNPGSCMTESMAMILTLSCLYLRLTPAEAFNAAMVNAAFAIGRGSRVGSLDPGMDGDVVIWNAPNYRYIPYHFGVNLVHQVIKAGKPVFSRDKS